jgi:hypothetical protein
MEWLNASLGALKDLIAFLNTQSRTHDVQKKQLLMELRDNLNVFKNGFLNANPYDRMIDLLSNEAIQQAVKCNFSFKRLKKGTIQNAQVFDERNKKYIGWDCEKLVDKIDEKIVELKNIKRLNNDTVKNAQNNVSLMMGNLYFRMKLLADFIRSQA